MDCLIHRQTRRRGPVRFAAWAGLLAVVVSAGGCGKRFDPAAPAVNVPQSARVAADDDDAAAVEIPAVKLRPVVYLEPADAASAGRGILRRELFRQALLVAARESLGLTARDGGLREQLPDGLSPENALRVGIRGGVGEVRLEVSRGPANGRKLLWVKRLPVVPADPVDLLAVAAQAEELSRAGFEVALKRAGFDGRPPAARPDAPVPPAAEQLLEEMTFPAQFQAARALHDAVRRQGESPALVGALARAYANLGLLTERHWGAAPKIYKARALLYAQRLARGDAPPAWGLWHRAYAAALAGLHRAALDDLARAGADRPPEWVDLIEAVCRFDAAHLRRVAGHPRHGRLAQLLWFRSVESRATAHLALQAAEHVLKDSPECFRVYDALASTGGVSTLHATTLAGMEAFTDMFPRRLKTIPGLPAGLAQALDQQRSEPEVFDALVAAGRSAQDGGEPSWAALGRWAQDTRFLQAALRLSFMRNAWGVPVDDFLPQARRMAAGHPYENYVRSYEFDWGRQREEAVRLLAAVPLADLDYQPDAFFQAVMAVGDPGQWSEVSRRCRTNFDDCHDDLAYDIAWMPDSAKAPIAHRMLSACPFAPVAWATLVDRDWAFARGRAAAWEKESQRPEVLVALARRYVAANELDAAERCLVPAVALAPDLTTYRLLAGVYKARGQADRWLATMEQVLQQEDTSLDHPFARVEIARHFMAQKDYRRAQPYADQAAQSWAGSGMLCAAECHEGLGEWDEAETWVRRLSERYPGDAHLWFFWCVRAGKGDVRAARQLLADRVAAMNPDGNPQDRLVYGAYCALTGEPRKAAEALQSLAGLDKYPTANVLAALFFDEAGDARRRDQALQSLDPRSPFMRLADFFVTSLAKGDGAPVDTGAADRVIESLPATPRVSAYYFVGRFLELRGQPQAARAYYERRLAAEPHSNNLTAVLAGSRLHAPGK